MWKKYNPNPEHARVGDCAIRAIAKATGTDWEHSFAGLLVMGFMMGDLPSANHVWGAYLRRNGYKREVIPNSCPDCYTVADFCRDNPKGKFVLALSGHVVAIDDGDWYDTWDSGAEVPLYYFSKEE